MKILLLNQYFYPDVAATAQHASDLASELSARGHNVTAISSRCAYDDPAKRLSKREVWHDISIVRLPCTAFDKSSRFGRCLNFASYYISCTRRLIFTGRQDVVIALTSPPLIAVLAALFVRLKGGALVYWVMDLNPDEAIAAGWLPQRSWPTAVLDAISCRTLRAADVVLALDRFMAERLYAKVSARHKTQVLPLWSHDRAVIYDPAGRLKFRKQHGLGSKYVVMYSGNHSPCHPLDTVLEAARALAGNPEVKFCFVGGGSEFRRVREFAVRHTLTNMLCLPYQPLADLSASLSAADLHVVLMGNSFVGIVHPCKIYNILAIGAPVLYIGPTPSHITDLLPESAANRWFFSAQHGDVSGTANRILDSQRLAIRRSRDEIRTAARFSQQNIVPQLIAAIEQVHIRDTQEYPQPAMTYSIDDPAR